MCEGCTCVALDRSGLPYATRKADCWNLWNCLCLENAVGGCGSSFKIQNLNQNVNYSCKIKIDVKLSDSAEKLWLVAEAFYLVVDSYFVLL